MNQDDARADVVTDHRLQIRLLGRFEVTLAGRTVNDAAWQRQHAKKLVKLLALNAQHRLHRDQIIERLWPDTSPERSSNNLNKILYIARRALEPSLPSGKRSRFLHRSGESIELAAEDGLWIDTEQFEARSNQAIKQGEIDLLLDSARLYTGDLLADELFDDEFADHRESLVRLNQRVLLTLAERSEAVAQVAQGIEALNRLTRVDPTNEDYHRRLMTLYCKNNQRSKALQQFQLCSDALVRELDELPDEQTASLYTSIKNNRATNPDQPMSAIRSSQASNDLTHSQSEYLAVMPFENARRESDLDYLCEGITENLIYSLSQLSGVRVMARSTVFRYQNHDIDPVALGKELSVNRVVLGRIGYQQESISIWVELVNTDDGLLEWGHSYERSMAEIQQLQHDICSDVSATLRVNLNDDTTGDANRRSTDSVTAYHHYLKGRYHWNKRSGQALQTALTYFQAAIDCDPVYALAYSGLADTYNLMSLYTSAAPHDTMPRARAAATRALEIDASLSEAHTSLAYCQLSYDWDWASAEDSFKRALQLDSTYATAHQWHHKQLVAMGRFEEARAKIAQAKILDPLSSIISTEEAWGLYHSRRYDEAIVHLDNVLKDDAHFMMAHFILGLVHLQKSNFNLAIEQLTITTDQLSQNNPFPLQTGALGHALAAAGRTDKSHQQLNKLRAMDTHSGAIAYAIALIHAGLGNAQQSLDALEQACTDRFDRLIFVPVEPMFDSLKNHPDFQVIIEKLNQTPATKSINPT